MIKADMNPDLLAAAVHTEPTEANMVRLLDEWSLKWNHKGRTRAVGLGAYENTAPPVSTLTAAPLASRVREMMKTLAEPSIIFESQISGQDVDFHRDSLQSEIGLHRDLLNLRGHPNHAVAWGSFTGGEFGSKMKMETQQKR